MSLSQREYDIRQIESELKIQSIFEEWKKAFLKGRMAQPQQPAPGAVNGVPNRQSANPTIPTE